MRLDEFYEPEEDRSGQIKANDTRKTRLTLKQLNKLRKVREIARAEAIEHDKFVKVMYASPSEEDTAL